MNELKRRENLNQKLMSSNDEVNELKRRSMASLKEIENLNEKLKSFNDMAFALKRESDVSKTAKSELAAKLQGIESLKAQLHAKNLECQSLESKLVQIQTQNCDDKEKNEELKRRNETIKIERDSRKLLNDRMELMIEEMSDLKKKFSAAERDKHEAQTRHEFLSTQLQQELREKRASRMKQQGETNTTVVEEQSLNDEIQGLK